MKYLSLEEVAEARKLRESGWQVQNIARHFGVCDATISKYVSKHVEPKQKKKPYTGRDLFQPLPFEEQDFSVLPDHVLFQHVRVWDFIG